MMWGFSHIFGNTHNDPCIALLQVAGCVLIQMISWAFFMISFWDGEVGWEKWCFKNKVKTSSFTHPKFNSSPLEIRNPERKLIFQASFFRGFGRVIYFRNLRVDPGCFHPKFHITTTGKDKLMVVASKG